MDNLFITSVPHFNLQNKTIYLFRITNSQGSYVELMNYGATLVSIVVPDRNGHMDNVILRYENPADYVHDKYYIGASIGRFANRITNASFALNGQVYHVDKNDGRNSQHGGFFGFDKKILDFSINKDGITFYGNSPEGECGFPGRVLFVITYRFSHNNQLTIEYTAHSDKPTPVSLTNHAYFNLSGQQNIFDHELKAESDFFLETDSEFLPTGKLLPVINDGFNFTGYKKLGSMMQLKKENIKGYNTYFVSRVQEKKLKRMVSLKEQSCGRMLDVYSTMPGVQLYTGDYLNGKHHPFSGLCLEAQYYPDFPNHKHFISSIISHNKSYNEIIVYDFSCF